MKRSRIFKGVRLYGRLPFQVKQEMNPKSSQISRAFNTLLQPPSQIQICVCCPHATTLSTNPFLRWDRRAKKEFLMDTLHFLPPKLERFSEKQLNQDYLQMRLGPYLSLYRGDSSNTGSAKAWMADLLSPFKFAPCISWRRVWLNWMKTARDKIKHKVPSVLTKSVRCPRFSSSEKPWKASKICSNPEFPNWALWVELSSVVTVCVAL